MTTLVVRCPTCERSVPWVPEQRWRPFCSERCKLIDLGEWASERHAIPGPAVDATELEEHDSGLLGRKGD